MRNTPFHAFYAARKLACCENETKLIPALASSDIKIFPYQIAAAEFALRSPYLKGCILCDEGSLGKTYEALLIATQKWYEGKTRQLIILPVNMVKQWTNKIDSSFSLPYMVIDNTETLKSMDCENPFVQDAVVVTTYDFAVLQADYIKQLNWDLIVFDEADCLNKSYMEDNKISTVLKDAANGFKLLLTPTPIEMDIRDIYGLIHFIDETVLPDIDEFYKRYFRKPENYPELASWVSKYCFRTLKSQVTDYVNFTYRIPYTIGCEMTKDERLLYGHLQEYLQMPKKLAYPKMERYDLTLQHCHILSSSPMAYGNTLNRAIDRLKKMRLEEKDKGLWKQEIKLLEEMKKLTETVQITGKGKTLLSLLKKCLSKLKQVKAPQKAVVFVDNLTTQKYLYAMLTEKGYLAQKYSGANSRDYSVMERFKNDNNIQILITTDEAAKGLDIEFCPLVINYDMLSNAVEMEQRISRCHRQGQKSDVIVINLFYKENFADVRYIELINKRVLQFDGIFGLSDTVLGNFDAAEHDVFSEVRHTQDVTAGFHMNLREHEKENKETVANAENILFTTFTKEIADKVTVTPQYLEQEIERLNRELWQVVKRYFTYWNNENPDCMFEINEQEQTVIASKSDELPVLFYYWTKNGYRAYQGKKKYAMQKGGAGITRITLSSTFARGVFDNIVCAENGTLTVDADIEPCTVGLYAVTASCGGEFYDYTILAGKTKSGAILSEEMCQKIFELPVIEYTESGGLASYQSRSVGKIPFHELDRVIQIDEIKRQITENNLPAQTEEISMLRLKTAHAKGKLQHNLDGLRSQIARLQAQVEETPVRIEKLKLEKQLKVLQKELRQQDEALFLNGIKLDTELEKAITKIQAENQVTCKVERQFIVEINGTSI